MAHESSNAPLSAINRRQMLGTGAALIGGAVTAFPEVAFAQGDVKTAAAVTGPNLNPPVVTIQGGKLRGVKDGKTLSFLGVRYAEAETFGPPKPVQAWEGVRNAQAWSPCCPIPAQSTVGADELVFPHRFWVQNENCQYLNVWTQNLRPAVKKPVMVWMHGGGFTNGSAIESYAYDGRSLSEFGDVVVVSINHRLNILGTLDLSAYGPEYANSRHTGMADIVASLEWVRDNIEAFGGDPGNVMIFGQSGGGGKVVRLMHMPAAKGLFHKVSAQSGSASYRNTDPATSIKNQRALAAATLKNLNLTGAQIDKLKTVLTWNCWRRALPRQESSAAEAARAGTRSPMTGMSCASSATGLTASRSWPDGLQRNAGHADQGRWPQERMVAEGNRRAPDRHVRRQ